MCCDETMELQDCRVLSNRHRALDLYEIRFEAPGIARAVEPGQFVHVLVPGMEGHILRRPFSVYDADADEGWIDILYRVVGFGSERLTRVAAGESCSIMGSLGHGWQLPHDAARILLVGGGLGAAPLHLLAKRAAASGVDVRVVLGATTADGLVCRERFAAALGAEPACATDDGSFGYPGFATGPVDALLFGSECQDGPGLSAEPFDYLAVCGPTPLMKLVAASAARAGVPCEASCERHMACGIGACLGCMVETMQGRKRSCVDGPVFDAAELIW